MYPEIMREGFDRELNSFMQTCGGGQTDAALLVMPQVGFLAYDDEYMLGTVARLEEELLTDGGLLLRYRTESGVDGLDRWGISSTLMPTVASPRGSSLNHSRAANVIPASESMSVPGIAAFLGRKALSRGDNPCRALTSSVGDAAGAVSPDTAYAFLQNLRTSAASVVPSSRLAREKSGP